MVSKKKVSVIVREYLNLLSDEKVDIRIISKSVDKISNIFMEDTEIRKKYSKRDIDDYFINICFFLEKNASDITDDDVATYVNNILIRKGETFICYVPLFELEDFPEGYKVGNSKIILSENLPSELKETINEHYASEYRFRDENERTLSLEDYKGIHISKCWIHRKLERVGYFKFYDDAYEKINDDLNILRIAYGQGYGTSQDIITLNHNDFFFFDPETKFFISSHKDRNCVLYLEPLDSEIKILNGLFLTETKTDIDNRIVTSLKIYGLQTTVTPIEIKFVLIVNALEGLLLSENDMNYLGKRLSEKVAFLVGKDKQDRIDVYKKMKETYNKRSNFTHQKQTMKEKDKITESDLLYLYNIFFGTIRKLLDLEKSNTILTIEGGEKSLDFYTRELMFSFKI
jgi:hypothetical protein